MLGFDPGDFGLPALLVGGVLVIALAVLILHLLFPVAKKPPRGVVLTKMARLCPVCQRKLTEAERNGLRIEVCPDCQGAWLSQDRLEQIMR